MRNWRESLLKLFRNIMNIYRYSYKYLYTHNISHCVILLLQIDTSKDVSLFTVIIVGESSSQYVLDIALLLYIKLCNNCKIYNVQLTVIILSSSHISPTIYKYKETKQKTLSPTFNVYTSYFFFFLPRLLWPDGSQGVCVYSRPETEASCVTRIIQALYYFISFYYIYSTTINSSTIYMTSPLGVDLKQQTKK